MKLAATKISRRDAGTRRTKVYVSVEGYLPYDEFIGQDPSKESRAAKRRSTQIMRDLICDTLFNSDEEVKITFSQKCGCSCGCSPGFVVSQFGEEIFVDAVVVDSPN